MTVPAPGFALRPFAPADRAWVAAAHGTHYRRVEGFDAGFDTAVAAALDDIEARLGRDRSFGLILWTTPAGARCGSIFCCAAGGQAARLRLFLLEPALHGRGLGRAMLAAATAQAQARGFRSLDVATFDAHAAACRLYARAGFEEVARRPCTAFGRSMAQVDFRLDLDPHLQAQARSRGLNRGLSARGKARGEMTRLIPADPRDPALRPAVEAHLAAMLAASPPGSSHALAPEALAAPGVHFFALHDGGAVVGFGAWKRLGPGQAELKSMHVLAARRGRGLGRALLHHLMTAARAEGITRLSLETGHDPAYGAAIALYRRAGFVDCAPFADYTDDPASLFLTCTLD